MSLLVIAISSLSVCFATTLDDNTAQLLEGKWRLVKVKEIGAWSIKHKNLLSENNNTTIEFNKNNQCQVIINGEKIETSYATNTYLEENYGVLIIDQFITTNISYYKKRNLKLSCESISLIPSKWEKIAVTKRKIVFYQFKDNGRIKYVLEKVN